MNTFLRRIGNILASRERTTGEPGSPNGASSFHLVWDLGQVPLRRVSATLEVLQPPSVRRLYFWALQVSFAGERHIQGAAHLGLQWNPRHPGSTAANWGGYGPAQSRRRLLTGSQSELPSARNDPNTRDLPWEPGHRYRLDISEGEPVGEGLHSWRGTIIDLESDRDWVVRDLYGPGKYLLSPMVWSEVFARCEQPGVAVRWSDFSAEGTDGEVLVPGAVRVNYQSRTDGGCDNTTVSVDELGILQATATTRQVPQGATLPISR